MTTKPPTNDEHLWEQYHAARESGDDAATRRLAGEIVECHLGFIRMYAEKNAFPQWGKEERDEFFQELVAFALTKVEKYDQTILGKNGRRAQFITFLRHSFQGVRWRVQADRFLIKQSVETKRLRAAMEQWHEDELLLNGRRPTDEETAEYLTVLMGKQKHPIGVAQVRRLRDQPVIIRADDDSSGHHSYDDARTGWDELDIGEASPEDLVVAADEEQTRTSQVAAALAQANLTEMEKVIVAERLMAAPRTVFDGDLVNLGPQPYGNIAKRFRVRVADVRQAEAALIAKLRDLLS